MLTGVDHTMKIMTEETFGPTLPIMKVRDADEAVRLANDTPLRAQLERVLQGHREGRAGRAAADAGNACVNDALMNYLALEAPFGGAGSRARRPPRRAGIRKYCATQTILVTPSGKKRELPVKPDRGRGGWGKWRGWRGGGKRRRKGQAGERATRSWRDRSAAQTPEGEGVDPTASYARAVDVPARTAPGRPHRAGHRRSPAFQRPGPGRPRAPQPGAHGRRASST